ncbi:MAG: hypothetical protein ACPGWR_02080 [Ardenticatenaceae bacterium]
MVTPNKEPILVLANSIFYHRANRPPANRYFHYPSYLPTSSLATESEAELTTTLQDSDVGAVLLSTVHRTQRLPQSIVYILFEEMVPVTSFTYPYQNDLLLFLPKQKTTATVISEPIEFESDILLNTFAVKVLAPTTLLVQLDWSTMSPLVKDYTVFTHLIGADGERVSQHDGWSVMNFRETTKWLPGESVMDWHWLELPSNAPAGTYDLQVGLYEAQTGERLRLQRAAQPDTTFVRTQIQIQGQ